jgi:ribonuclease H2 subunit A
MSAAKRQRSSVEFDADEFMQAYDVTPDCLILGIDEAGRGPVIGPMVYTGAVISLKEHDKLIDLCCVADSKTLNDASRRSSAAKLLTLESFKHYTVSLPADVISSGMCGRLGRNLNVLSHDTAISIIHQATIEAKGKLVAVFVDTVGHPEVYQRKLSGRFPHLRITVSAKADSKFPIVSAASIFAKTTRDTEIDDLHLPVGSGYPSDPLAAKWIRSNVHKFFVFGAQHSFVRHSWGPVVAIARSAACVQVDFEQDVENRGEDSRQKRISFEKPRPKREAAFTNIFGLRTATPIDL